MLKLKLTLLVAVILLLAADVASACSCAMPTVAEARDKAKVVFAGRYIGAGPQGHRFKVERVWKGAPSAEITVLVRRAGTSCDPGLKRGRKLLVYAYPGGEKFPLVASYCGRTQVLKMAGDDIKRLGEKEPAGSVRARPVHGGRVVSLRHNGLPNNGMQRTRITAALSR